MKNVYEVAVSQMREYFGYIEVIADSEEEAREIAEGEIEDFDNWSFGGTYPVEIDDIELQHEQDDEEDEDE
ncbi:hypothetical protein [Burkholderia sp. LMG 13014]|uniref:hypothetical protein n=1 Tax=Burkholderia sp. LMG 13014 TaxID=2709306 RepID=UPI0019660E6C|nr:hypothetical protein [Burkholderia sp. LMG 13014]